MTIRQILKYTLLAIFLGFGIRVDLMAQNLTDSSLTPKEMFDKGIECYNTKNYTKALEWFEKGTERGYAAAQFK